MLRFAPIWCRSSRTDHRVNEEAQLRHMITETVHVKMCIWAINLEAVTVGLTIRYTVLISKHPEIKSEVTG